MNTTEMPSGGDLLGRAIALAVNGFEVARYGGLRTESAPAPYDVVTSRPVYRLRHYHADTASGQPVLLVPPLMQVADVWDISPDTSAVSMLRGQGLDPWVVDFGDPAVEPGGPSRTFSDHVLAVVDAINCVREATGQDVHVGGYSQGGIFCYLAAAYSNCDGVASVFGLGSPVVTLPIDRILPESLFWEAARLEGKLLARTGLPRWAVAPMFNWSNPPRTIKNDLDFLLALHDRDALLPREPQRKFLKHGAWLGWPGPAIEELVAALSERRLVDGGIVIGDRTVALADLTCPVLAFIGESDTFATPAMVRRIQQAAPRATIYECVLPVGHFGLPVSSHAKAKTWPGIAAFIRWATEGTALPDYIVPMAVDNAAECAQAPRGRVAALSYGLGSALHAGLALPQLTVEAGQRLAGAMLESSVGALSHLPRLVKLERLGPDTRVSFAGMLDDTAGKRGDDIAFLFEDRAHTHAATKIRIDNVVSGLLSVGIRRGEYVGVLMGTRPSALTAVAALNRIGAVAVMLRPGEDTLREVGLAHVSRILSDPENASAAVTLDKSVFVLGGGADRGVAAGAIDLEQVDPDSVEHPAWYHANPGRGRDIAFVLFSGHDEHTRANRVTNARWASSALAAASAAALTPRDTVYSISPLHHPSGLMLATAAPAASGARMAMATRFAPDRFWSEVRRYGVTVVPYTWTMLHALVDAPVHAEERGHSIRLFVGSGMPAGLWQRVHDRFGSAAVLELYASTRSDAMLGNVSGRKVGALGRPLPGSPRVRVVAYDADTGAPSIGTDGYARACDRDETGLLLVEADPHHHGGNEIPLHGMFADGDAWLSTGDLFRVDRDGELWFVDSLAALIPTSHGTVSPHTVEGVLGGLDAVDLAACFPVPSERGVRAVAMVTVREAAVLTTEVLNGAFAELDPDARPDVVGTIDAMPTNSWFRPSVQELQNTEPTLRWHLDRRSGRYRTTTTTSSNRKAATAS
ncbi:alpha/beta fold hydrolase [Gordonia sp. CPCC 205515]|uniref:alpha/beta fold hydrolase n=1 Tax=Gordonia sp. CPCC 205515 TaxID=3140791 RepID=UPI003AF33ECF